ncbi:hypothetical protein NYR97_19635 [Xanthomonas hydrangeae]|uniref:Antitoxin Xre/MbcA/ParS-like toxin-binding domain-containing protein n=1 Tax=Xanthomonas hydrangeae TaxID=2775159 RepID=A0AAU0B8V8_9XANT|nr:hypothetical protein [Xanthomonas hydrangeae]WOB49387.1 hypothetical protein NYR97_19635 [Xanthomonas hydrangeae]
MALKIVPVAEAAAWFHHDPIRELGGETAAELATRGHSAQVVSFLQSVLRGERD